MGYFRGIAERYKDPVEWIHGILFLVILCYGLWTHHWFSIIASGACILVAMKLIALRKVIFRESPSSSDA